MSNGIATSDKHKAGPRHPAVEFLLWLINLMASIRCAVWLVFTIVICCVLGTILPQHGAVLQHLKVHPDHLILMVWLTRIGFTRVFSVWWFSGLLILLASSLMICTVRRFKSSRTLKGKARGRAIASVVTHVSMILILIGGMIRNKWGEKGMLRLHEGQRQDWFQSDSRRVTLPFTVHLKDFELERHEPKPGDNKITVANEQLYVTEQNGELALRMDTTPGTTVTVATDPSDPHVSDDVTITVIDRVLDLVVDSQTKLVRSRSDQPNNPAILVEVVWDHGSATNRQWHFARYPGFNMYADQPGQHPLSFQYLMSIVEPSQPQVKDFRSRLEILVDDEVVASKTIEVNAPLSHGGYTFFQSGYNPDDLTWSSILVVKDPSTPIVYTGFALLILGLFVLFYMYPAAPGPKKQLRKPTKEY